MNEKAEKTLRDLEEAAEREAAATAKAVAGCATDPVVRLQINNFQTHADQIDGLALSIVQNSPRFPPKTQICAAWTSEHNEPQWVLIPLDGIVAMASLYLGMRSEQQRQ